MTGLARLLGLPIRAYRLVFSPWVGHNCRYRPTCSAYALEALAQHGGLKGAWLTLCRIVRCHPFSNSGYDPVPPSGKQAGDQRPASVALAGPNP